MGATMSNSPILFQRSLHHIWKFGCFLFSVRWNRKKQTFAPVQASSEDGRSYLTNPN